MTAAILAHLVFKGRLLSPEHRELQAGKMTGYVQVAKGSTCCCMMEGVPEMPWRCRVALME
jgi:hypothetical protein